MPATLKHHVKEQPVRRCAECPSVISCLATEDGTWKCQEIMDEDENGRRIGFRTIPNQHLQGDFPSWCPFEDISNNQWIEIAKARAARRGY